MKEEVEGLFSLRVSRMRRGAVHADVFYGWVGDSSPMDSLQRIGDLVFTEDSWSRFLSILQLGAEALVTEIDSIRFVPARVLVTGDVNVAGEQGTFLEFPERIKDDADVP